MTKEERQRTGQTHTLNHSHWVNTLTMRSFLLSACGSFYWMDNRINKRLGHFISRVVAGKEAVMLPARCCQAHPQAGMQNTHTHKSFSTHPVPLPRQPCRCKSPADGHVVGVREKISLFPSLVWKKPWISFSILLMLISNRLICTKLILCMCVCVQV